MYTVAGRIIAITLGSIRELTIIQYPRILAHAGLTRFAHNLPSLESDEPLATREEICALYVALYNMVGERGLRRFMRNFGYKVYEYSRTFSTYAEIQEKVRSLPEAERLEVAFDLLTRVTSRWMGDQRSFSADERNFYLIISDCIYCAPFKGLLTRPLCENLTITYRETLRDLTGFAAIGGFESSCAAIGDRQCIFTYPRVGGTQNHDSHA